VIDIISSKEFKELLYKSLLDSKWEISQFQNKLKEQYKKAWGSSEWLDIRLAKEYTNIIVNNMIDTLQEADEQEER